MTKRRTALFLAICMLLSMFSTVTYADDSDILTKETLDIFLVSENVNPYFYIIYSITPQKPPLRTILIESLVSLLTFDVRFL